MRFVFQNFTKTDNENKTQQICAKNFLSIWKKNALILLSAFFSQLKNLFDNHRQNGRQHYKHVS